MKIVGLDAYAYSAPYRTPISNGKYTYATTEIIVVRMKTDDGLDGYGWVHGGRIVFDAILDMEKRVIGEDPFNVERIWNKLYLPKVYGRKGLTTRAISAIDVSLWDIMGKVAGRPLYQLIGGYRDSIPAYIAGGYYEANKACDELKAEMRHNVALGAKAVKMKIGGASITEDVNRIQAVREEVGGEVAILVDANNAYNRIDALKMGRQLEQLDVYWFEEPLSPDDIEGCAELARKLDVTIAVGENEYTRWGFKQLLEAGVAQVLNADALVLGGITEWKKVADLAVANHVLIAPHGDQEIHTHLVCGVPNGLIAEYYESNTNVLRSAMFRKTVSLDAEGHVTPLQDPGIGVTIEFDALEPHKVCEYVSGATGR